MNIKKRLDRLEGAMVANLDPDSAATFAALVVALDEMAARKVAGCVIVQREIDALMKSLEGNDDGKPANAT